MGRVQWKGGSLSSTLFSSHRPQRVFFFPSSQPPHDTEDSAGESGDTEWLIKAFPSSPGPLYQNEVKCPAFDMEMIFHCHASKTHFRKKGCALGLILKVGGFGTRRAVAYSHDC